MAFAACAHADLRSAPGPPSGDVRESLEPLESGGRYQSHTPQEFETTTGSEPNAC